MDRRSRFIFAGLLVATVLLVAWQHWPVAGAVLVLLVVFSIRQLMLIKALTSPARGPELELETILPSHFAEKGRWCLDRLGVEYSEKQLGGIIGVFFTGRTVPMLTIRTGRTVSTLCESSHVLRYLYGRFSGDLGEKAEFLEPTPERLAWEEKLDQYGVFQQVWVYHHLIRHPDICKEAWGARSTRLPAWQRWTILVMYPFFEMLIKRGFNPNKENYAKAVDRTESLLGETEALLKDGRLSMLGGENPDFVDITLASLSALWIQPDEFAAGAYQQERVEHDRLPQGMRDDMARWRMEFPATTAHIERLYRDYRTA